VGIASKERLPGLGFPGKTELAFGRAKRPLPENDHPRLPFDHKIVRRIAGPPPCSNFRPCRRLGSAAKMLLHRNYHPVPAGVSAD
jgi:hypothetical protein